LRNSGHDSEERVAPDAGGKVATRNHRPGVRF
jgi:hypothetical protein